MIKRIRKTVKKKTYKIQYKNLHIGKEKSQENYSTAG